MSMRDRMRKALANQFLPPTQKDEEQSTPFMEYPNLAKALLDNAAWVELQELVEQEIRVNAGMQLRNIASHPVLAWYHGGATALQALVERLENLREPDSRNNGTGGR